MKFLHTADLHIGKTVNGYPMIEEQRNIFSQMLEYIKNERPDFFIIAGDVYDRAIPGVEAVALFDDFLTGLAESGTPLFLIAGNHDSPERLSFASRILAEKNLNLCCSFDGGMKKFTLGDEFGEVDIFMLPFIKPSTVRRFFPDREIESCTDAVEAVLSTAGINPEKRNILISHQFYIPAGGGAVRSDSELDPVGGLDAADAALLGIFDYAALGHLHGAQKSGGANIRYSGSPLKYSFSEHRQKKGLYSVELRQKGEVKIDALPLFPLREMREIKGSLAEILALDPSEDYIRAVLTDAEEPIDPLGKIRSRFPNVMTLEFLNSHSSTDLLQADCETAEKLSRYELFCEFFLASTGHTLTAEQERAVFELGLD